MLPRLAKPTMFCVCCDGVYGVLNAHVWYPVCCAWCGRLDKHSSVLFGQG